MKLRAPARLMTTAEAARVAGVGPTAIKRWSDEGLLKVVRTAGGHRRFDSAEVERFLRERSGLPAATVVPEAERWLEALLTRADGLELVSMLHAERARRGSWHAVATHLAPVIIQLGAAWERGQITVLEEHLASEQLERALTRVVEDLPLPARAPRALLATATGEQHTLGLSLVELTLREAGWRTRWAGRNTPTSELVRAVERGQIDLVALSASVVSQDAPSLTAELDRLAQACARADVALLYGGSGAWPDRHPVARRVEDFETLAELARVDGALR